MDAGATSGDSGDADSGSSDAFDTWSDDCWDAHRNISIAALLELKGWQLQEFASQQGYTWQDALEMYEDEAGHVLSVCNISKDGATEWLGEDEIGKLDKGGTGSTVMFTLQLSGYSSCGCYRGLFRAGRGPGADYFGLMDRVRIRFQHGAARCHGESDGKR